MTVAMSVSPFVAAVLFGALALVIIASSMSPLSGYMSRNTALRERSEQEQAILIYCHTNGGGSPCSGEHTISVESGATHLLCNGILRKWRIEREKGLSYLVLEGTRLPDGYSRLWLQSDAVWGLREGIPVIAYKIYVSGGEETS